MKIFLNKKVNDTSISLLEELNHENWQNFSNEELKQINDIF